MDALKNALKRVPQTRVKEQIQTYVPPDVQQVLASAGIRDEHVFPVPAVLESKPTLVGYYRLLLGIPQKSFYNSATGMGQFKSMETRGFINPRKVPDIDGFCAAMAQSLSELVRQTASHLSPRDIGELPLLTFGSQLQGANNNIIGKQATVDVFLSVTELVKEYVQTESPESITLTNTSGRTVLIALSSDPDIRVQEDFNGKLRNKVAIEIKGGTDVSNVHNRAGEAEKSHQKAKRAGFRDFWTLISTRGISLSKLQSESPTTNSWFDVAQVLGRQGHDWEEFSSRLADVTGIPLKSIT